MQINSVTLETVRPPQEVDEAFRDVVSAREDRQRVVNEAQGLRRRPASQCPRRGRADSFGSRGRCRGNGRKGPRRGRPLRAHGGPTRSPGAKLTARRLILETLEEVLPKMKKIVLDDQAQKQIDLGVIEDQ